MSHVAIINEETGVIENIAIVEEDSDWTPPSDKRIIHLPHDYEAGIGWTHNSEEGTFTAPPEPSEPSEPPEPSEPEAPVVP